MKSVCSQRVWHRVRWRRFGAGMQRCRRDIFHVRPVQKEHAQLGQGVVPTGEVKGGAVFIPTVEGQEWKQTGDGRE